MKTEVLAMPGLCDVTDFGLSNEAFNTKKAKQLMARPKEEIFDLGDDVKVWRSGDEGQGNIFLYNPTVNLIGYFLHYKRMDKKLSGLTVTQTMLWRAKQEPKANGITNRIVFDYLLRNYPAILSDRLQTIHGREFWLRLMMQAITLKHKVNVVDYNSQKMEPVTMSELRLMDSGHDEDFWGFGNRYQAIRFMISR
jgi:hypothetical protein